MLPHGYLCHQAGFALQHMEGKYPKGFDPETYDFDYMSDFEGKVDVIKMFLLWSMAAVRSGPYDKPVNRGLCAPEKA